MKSFEAKTATHQENYEKVMKKIKDGIKRGWQSVWVDRYCECKPFLNDPEEVIEKLLENGYDIILHYDDEDDLKSVNISWENSKEGRKGVAKIKKDEKKPEQPKRGFFGWLKGSYYTPEDDGVCMDF